MASAAESAIRQALSAAAGKRSQIAILAHILGTDSDPQNLARQATTLTNAGVQLFESNARMASAAKLMLAGVPA